MAKIGPGGLVRGERLQFMLSAEELQAVDTFRFEHRMPSRAAALRDLLRLGLKAAGAVAGNADISSREYGVLKQPKGLVKRTYRKGRLQAHCDDAMPITQFLNGHRFDPETSRILGVAFEQVCAALRIGDCDDDVKQAIATHIIELAKTGERNPDLLCECALKDIRRPQSEQ